MNLRITSLFGILSVVACSSSTKKYNLTDEQLGHLMLDIQLSETTLSDLSPEHQDSVKHLFDKRMQEIYHLSADEIKQEVDMLQADPEKLKLIINKAKELADSIQ